MDAKFAELRKSSRDEDVERYYSVALQFYDFINAEIIRPSTMRREEDVKTMGQDFAVLWKSKGFLIPKGDAEIKRNKEERLTALKGLSL